MPPIRFVTTNDGVRIAYSTHGAGPALVFVRGWISHLELHWEDPAYRAYFEALARHFLVVRYDARGNGLSQREVPEVGLADLALDLEAVIEELDLSDLVLYGATFGGPIAVSYAVAHPERVAKLILEGTYARGQEITTPERQAAIIEGMRISPEAGFLLLSHYSHPEPQQSSYRRPERGPELISPEMAAQLYTLAYQVDVTDLLPNIQAPTLVLHRRRSWAIPYNLGVDVASRIPGAHFVALEGKAHNLFEGDAASALAAIGDFLGVRVELEVDRRPHLATVLFTDIADSTALTEQMGDAAFRTKSRALDTTLRGLIREAGGRPVEGKLLGDGVLAIFTSASQAIEFAVRGSAAGDEAGLPLHLGIHAGDVIREGNDVYGGAVNVAARIAGASLPSEILVSEIVRGLARTSTGVEFTDRGERALKGVAEPVRLFAVDETGS